MEMKFVVSGFRRGTSDVFPLVGFYAALICTSIQLLAFRDSLSVPSSMMKQSNENYSWTTLSLEDGTDRLSRNVGKLIQINGV
jgi:hypothetical protein